MVGRRLIEAPLRVALSGVTGSGSSEACKAPKSLCKGAAPVAGVMGEKRLVPIRSPLTVPRAELGSALAAVSDCSADFSERFCAVLCRCCCIAC